MKKEELFEIIGEVDEQKVLAAGTTKHSKKKTNAIWIRWGVMAACLCLVVGLVFNISNSSSPRLSEDEISQLREQYPISGQKAPEMVSISSEPLESLIELTKKFHTNPETYTFVYAEVVGEARSFDKNISTGNSALDEAYKEHGIDLNHEFYEYTLSVIKDTEKNHKEGDIITISANMMFIDYYPKLTDGMKIVVPIADYDELDNTRYSFDNVGMYYITENGYAISAYDEESLLEREPLSGMHVDDLLKELHKMLK